MRRPTGLGEYRTEELEAELEARKQANQYKCPSYYDEEAALQDCECGRCGVQPDNTPLNADPNLRRTVNQMLDFFTEPDKGEKYLKDLEDEIVELVKKHELQARLDEVKRLNTCTDATIRTRLVKRQAELSLAITEHKEEGDVRTT